ncbi:DNA repair and recombination protein RadB [Candidatus Nanohaloarchaea archaeon]|nr:DNA repair and recombination protein RadB [Candidatus Nanohaloarchaea archaeon]
MFPVKVERVSTRCESVDKLLNGGIEKGIITNFYGGSGTGKTNVCIQIAATVAENGGKVIYIDTEGGFSPERFEQVASEKALENLLLRDPVDFEEQEEAIDSLADVVESENVELVIVDSAVSLYRLQVNGENASEINQRLSRQLSELSKIARTHEIPVVITNQVYTSFDDDELELVGRDVPKYWSKALLQLSEKSDGTRKIKVAKHRSIPEGRSTQFDITNDGLETPENKGLF